MCAAVWVYAQVYILIMWYSFAPGDQAHKQKPLQPELTRSFAPRSRSWCAAAKCILSRHLRFQRAAVITISRFHCAVVYDVQNSDARRNALASPRASTTIMMANCVHFMVFCFCVRMFKCVWVCVLVKCWKCKRQSHVFRFMATKKAAARVWMHILCALSIDWVFIFKWAGSIATVLFVCLSTYTHQLANVWNHLKPLLYFLFSLPSSY